MNKEEYFKSRELLIKQQPKIKFGSKPTEEQKEISKKINSKLQVLLEQYIDSCKPCSIGNKVNMTLNEGRKVKEVFVANLGILHDGNIHPTAYIEQNKTKYITKPVLKIEVIN